MSDEIKTVPEEEAEEAFRTDEIYSYHARKIGHSHHRHSRGKKAVKAAVITLAALPFVLAAAGLILFFHYYNLMDIKSIPSADKKIDYSDVNVTFSDTELSEIPEGTVEVPDGGAYSQKNVTNILLIGTDERTDYFDYRCRADSMMILSLNRKTDEVKLISLERGMLVSIPGRKPDILTHTFRYGGAALLIQTVESHFKIHIDNYVRINFFMFKKLIDEIGGVDVSISQKEADAMNALHKYSPVTEGMNHMDGATALSFSRLRRIDSDWRRIERQRKVIAAIKTKMKGKSVFELSGIADNCLPYVQTDLSSGQFASLLIKMPDFASGNFAEMTIPAKGTYRGLGNVNFAENSRILKEYIYG